MVHGGLDGFLRLPVYLHLSNNNRADTVLNLFKEAVFVYDVPSHILMDLGGKNIDDATYLYP